MTSSFLMSIISVEIIQQFAVDTTIQLLENITIILIAKFQGIHLKCIKHKLALMFYVKHELTVNNIYTI